MTNAHFERGRVLYENGRPDLAEPELRKALAAEPDNGLAHAYLALCLACLGRRKKLRRRPRRRCG